MKVVGTLICLAWILRLRKCKKVKLNLLGKTRLFVKERSCLGKSEKSVEKRFCGEKEISENPAFFAKKTDLFPRRKEKQGRALQGLKDSQKILLTVNGGRPASKRPWIDAKKDSEKLLTRKRQRLSGRGTLSLQIKRKREKRQRERFTLFFFV